MNTNTFKTPFLVTQPDNVPYLHSQYNKVKPAVRELFFEGAMTASLFFVNKENVLRIGVNPRVEKDTNGVITHVEINLTNDWFQPSKVSPKVLKYFVGVAHIADVPTFAAEIGTIIPEECLTVLEYDGAAIQTGFTLTLYALRCIFLAGFGKA